MEMIKIEADSRYYLYNDLETNEYYISTAEPVQNDNFAPGDGWWHYPGKRNLKASPGFYIDSGKSPLVYYSWGEKTKEVW